MRFQGTQKETENTVKAARYNDGAIRMVIPKDICEAYHIEDGDELGHLVVGHPYVPKDGDLVLKVIRKAKKEASKENGALEN